MLLGAVFGQKKVEVLNVIFKLLDRLSNDQANINSHDWSAVSTISISSIFKGFCPIFFCICIYNETVIKSAGSRMRQFLTMSGPQLVPSAAGMNLVSHRCPVRWHHSDLQMSCQTSQTHTQYEMSYQIWYFVSYDCSLTASWHRVTPLPWPASTCFLPGPPSRW